jgi:hypothetical protein
VTGSLQGLVWVATTPEGLCDIGQRHYPRILSHMVGQVAVGLEVVEGKSLLQMRLRGSELAEPAQGSPQQCMHHEGQGGILLSLRNGEELFPHGERRGVIPACYIRSPQSKQEVRDLERLPHLQTQLLRVGVGLLHFGAAIPLRDHQGRPETEVESEFLAGSGGGSREGLEQFKSRGEVVNGFLIRGMPRRLLSCHTEILDGLCGIPTVTVMVRKLAVVVFEVGLVEDFHRVRGLLMERFALLLQHRAVGHFLRQSVFIAYCICLRLRVGWVSCWHIPRHYGFGW